MRNDLMKCHTKYELHNIRLFGSTDFERSINTVQILIQMFDIHLFRWLSGLIFSDYRKYRTTHFNFFTFVSIELNSLRLRTNVQQKTHKPNQ